jgi:hypothetical protein
LPSGSPPLGNAPPTSGALLSVIVVPTIRALPARIVVTLRSSQDPAYLVHAPMELTFWVVAAAPDWDTLNRFSTLRAALNFIRPVLAEPDAR